jgi:hypothetical protein
MIKLVNFGHKMSEKALKNAERLLKSPVEEVEINLIISFGEKSMSDQLLAIINHVRDCEGDYAIALPGSSIVTAGLLATLAGLSGILPRVVIMARIESEFLPYEVIDLQAIKIAARMKRDKNAIKVIDLQAIKIAARMKRDKNAIKLG